jgi:integrase/recombinase XerD
MLIALLAEGVKQDTVTWYRVRLARFLSKYGDWDVKKIDIDAVRDYIVWLRGEELSPHYFYSHVRVVRRLFKWLYEERWINNPFWRRLKLPKLPQQLPKAVEISDVARLLSHCDESIAGKRDRAIIIFLLDTGCRVGGLCKLKNGELDLEKMKAKLHEKGDKVRVVLFEEITVDALYEWLEVRPPNDCEFVFTSLAENRPMNPNSVLQMLRRRKRRHGIEGRVNPHAFRHAFGREYILSGGDLASASDLMGHSQIAVTKNYYAVFLPEEHREKHKAFSPANQLQVKGG